MAKLSCIVYIVRLLIPTPVGCIPCTGSVLFLSFRHLSFILPQGRPLDEGKCFFVLNPRMLHTHAREAWLERGGGLSLFTRAERAQIHLTIHIHTHNHRLTLHPSWQIGRTSTSGPDRVITVSAISFSPQTHTRARTRHIRQGSCCFYPM